MKKPIFFLIASLSAIAFQCKKENSTTNNTQTPTTDTVTFFAKGADVSWLTQMESQGIKFYDEAGNEKDCMQILKDEGINSIRLRAWVNPAGGWNNTKDVVAKAIRAKNLGMKIMIDFHYSDTWADPGHQTKPAAWTSLTISDLQTAVYNYTKGVMDTLKLNGITPQWVQVGNETDDGMLWDTGKANPNMNTFAGLITQGYNAVKASSSSTQVIVHVSNGWDNTTFRWLFDGITNWSAKFDIIGMSLYPSGTTGGMSTWSTVNQQCLANMKDMVTRYKKPVMIVEVGAPVGDPTTAKAFLVDLISKTKSVTNGGLGVFYWEPECYNNWQGYSLGAFDNTGKPTAAMQAFN